MNHVRSQETGAEMKHLLSPAFSVNLKEIHDVYFYEGQKYHLGRAEP